MNNSLVTAVTDADDYMITFSTKADGNMYRTNETRVAVHNNRLRFLRKCRVDPDNLFMIRTSHSPNVEAIDREPGVFVKRTYLQRPVIETDFDHYYTGSDGAITFNRTLFIGLTSGDCVPVVLWDNLSGMHGILHVGLLGALNGMVKVLPRIFDDTGVDLGNARFYLGPSITQRNYDVSRSGLWTVISSQAYSNVASVGNFIIKDISGDHFDVRGLIVAKLEEIGVKRSQIQGYPHCVADPGSIFFSHNVLKVTGERGSFFSIIGPNHCDRGD